jgi:hypothetical protein
MMYQISISRHDKPTEGWIVNSIEAAREEARRFVQDRIDAFSEDRDVLKRYGFLDAEDRALDLPEEGGKILMQDGWAISVQPAKL